MKRSEADTKPDIVTVGILVADLFPGPLRRLPDQGELVVVDSIALSAGGCAANTAVALSRLGKKTGVIGKIGRDPFGRFIIEDLGGKGIDVSRITQSADQETSKTIILPVAGEDRRYLHLFGANADFALDDIDLTYLETAKALYVGGYLGMPRFHHQDLAAVFKHAKHGGLFTALDVIVSGPGDHLSVLTPVLPFVDVFLPNEDEARLITGEVDPVRQADVFLESGAKNVIITMGAGGALARSTSETLRLAAYPVPYVDGSGAGDAFDAGFLAASVDGKPLEYALKLGSAMGASCVGSLGCSAGLFTEDQADEFIRGHE